MCISARVHSCHSLCRHKARRGYTLKSMVCVKFILSHIDECCILVYKIPYRRARAWPAGFRPSASREQRYLAYKLYTRYPIVERRAWPAGFRPSASREQRYLAYKDECF